MLLHPLFDPALNLFTPSVVGISFYLIVMFIAGVLIGPLLTIAFVIPWISSFKVVRRRMEPLTWRNVQKLACPFTIFMLAQGRFLALGRALYLYPFDGMRLFETLYQGGAAFRSDFAGYVASAWIYAALLVAYPVLRLRRRHKAKPQNLVERRSTRSDSSRPSGKPIAEHEAFMEVL